MPSARYQIWLRWLRRGLLGLWVTLSISIAALWIRSYTTCDWVSRHAGATNLYGSGQSMVLLLSVSGVISFDLTTGNDTFSPTDPTRGGLPSTGAFTMWNVESLPPATGAAWFQFRGSSVPGWRSFEFRSQSYLNPNAAWPTAQSACRHPVLGAAYGAGAAAGRGEVVSDVSSLVAASPLGAAGALQTLRLRPSRHAGSMSRVWHARAAT